MWLRALKVMNKNNSIQDKIILKCETHSNKTEIKCAKDFDKIPDGGCTEICKIRMMCGHSCERICHYFEVTDSDVTGHETVKCEKNCVREKPCGHPCKYRCFQCKL